MTYTLRVPVRTLGTLPVTGLDDSKSIVHGGLQVTLIADPPYLTVSVEGFATEGEALAFLPQVERGLWALVIRWNIAFRANLEPRIATYTDDPVTAGNNIAKTFGGTDGPPVDVLLDVSDVVVYRTTARVKWLKMGDIEGRVSTKAEKVLETLQQGISVPSPILMDARFQVAMDLFNSHFFETSIRSRFLTLVMILEVLAPNIDKHEVAQRLVKEFKDSIQIVLSNTDDADAKDALTSLDRELDFRRETSIRQRVRRLIRNAFTQLEEGARIQLEKSVVSAYDARGTLTHTGYLSPAQLDVAHEEALAVVRRLLSMELGVSAV